MLCEPESRGLSGPGSSQQSYDPPARQIQVLLVEDSWVDARLVLGLLAQSGEALACKHAPTLKTACELAHSSRFDVVLLDLNLDDSSGYTTFAGMLQAAPAAAIVVLSGSDNDELALRTVKEGAQDYLVKGSFDGKLLYRSIRYAFERKQTQEALRRSESAVRAIFENSLDGILISDNAGLCVEANPAASAILGMSRQQLQGTRLTALVEDGENSTWGTTDQTGRTHFMIVRPDGVRRTVDCSFRRDILPGQHLSVLRDVTDQQKLEEQLRQSQKMEAVGRLAGGVAHDFNNILGIITGYAELVQLSVKDEAVHEKLDKILAASQKASSLTKQLLAFGKKQVISPRLIDLPRFLDEITPMLTCMLSAEIQVQKHVARELGRVKADQGQLEQVILNLAANARDVMPQGGTLGIRAENCQVHGSSSDVPAGQYVRLSVTDTGCGMAPETQARIFEPFFTTKKAGAGLGLSTVYGIVNQSGGHIRVHSAPGQGTEFHVYLPVVEAAQPGEHEIAARPARKVLLLADDEDELRKAAVEYLQGCGFEVLSAKDGKEGIDISDAHSGRIDLVISDVVMPRINGRGLVEHIRKTRPDARILLISGYADGADLRNSSIADNAFLQKPFSFRALDEAITRLMNSPGTTSSSS